MTSTPNTDDAIAYATPVIEGRRPSVMAGAALLTGGLGLVLLGGCFLIGVLLNIQRTTVMQTKFATADVILMTVLYLAAFGCFIGATILIIRGGHGLIRLLYHSH